MITIPLDLKYRSDATLVVSPTFLDTDGIWKALSGADVDVTLKKADDELAAVAPAAEVGTTGVYQYSLSHTLNVNPGDVITAEIDVEAPGGKRTFAGVRVRVVVDRD